jgi:hypothetical protein
MVWLFTTAIWVGIGVVLGLLKWLFDIVTGRQMKPERYGSVIGWVWRKAFRNETR